MTDAPKKSEDEPGQAPTLSIDWEAYEAFLTDSDASDEQKRELIVIMWRIVVSFVDLAFGCSPVQRAIEENLKERTARERDETPAADEETQHEDDDEEEPSDVL